jgi:hypothetical protein
VSRHDDNQDLLSHSGGDSELELEDIGADIGATVPLGLSPFLAKNKEIMYIKITLNPFKFPHHDTRPRPGAD